MIAGPIDIPPVFFWVAIEPPNVKKCRVCAILCCEVLGPRLFANNTVRS
jgi:hypothetical protein